MDKNKSKAWQLISNSATYTAWCPVIFLLWQCFWPAHADIVQITPTLCYSRCSDNGFHGFLFHDHRQFHFLHHVMLFYGKYCRAIVFVAVSGTALYTFVFVMFTTKIWPRQLSWKSLERNFPAASHVLFGFLLFWKHCMSSKRQTYLSQSYIFCSIPSNTHIFLHS